MRRVLFEGSRLEDLDIRRKDHPMQSRSSPHMPGRFDPVRVVERSNRNPAHARNPFGSIRHCGPAGRTKLQLCPTVAFVRPIFIRSTSTANKFDGCFRKICRYSKSAAGPALAKSAMTNSGYHRIACNSISNGSAETTAFMCLCHFATFALSAGHLRTPLLAR